MNSSSLTTSSFPIEYMGRNSGISLEMFEDYRFWWFENKMKHTFISYAIVYLENINVWMEYYC